MKKEYRYLGHKSRGGAVSLRPQLQAEVIYGGRRRNVYCLIDSGSDHTLVNADLAEILGVDLSKCPKLHMHGVSDPDVDTRLAEVSMEFDGFDERFIVQARFVRGMTLDVILGQSDFFEDFRIEFERKRGRFYLTRESTE